MNLDEAVRVSAIHLDGFSSAHHGRDCVMCVAARAVLAMAPVVEAVCDVISATCLVCETYGLHFTSDPCAHTTASDALRAALSTLSSKVPHGE